MNTKTLTANNVVDLIGGLPLVIGAFVNTLGDIDGSNGSSRLHANGSVDVAIILVMVIVLTVLV